MTEVARRISAKTQLGPITLDQKAQVLTALVGQGFSIHYRSVEASPWYVRLDGVEEQGDGVLGSIVAGGHTPEEAVNEAWIQVSTKTLRLGGNSNPRNVKWNGFMFAEVPLPNRSPDA